MNKDKKIKKLTEALEDAVELLCLIRYCEWESDDVRKGVFIGVELIADDIDEVLIKAEKQLPKEKT